MKRLFLPLAIAGALVVIVVAVVVMLAAGDDDPKGGGRDADATTSAVTTAADDAWCAGWDQLVLTQGTWVADPNPTNADAVIAAVDGLQALGAPESLDPSGYTEMNAVLDDVRGSVDPSFTPSVAPSEPADVEHGNADEAPFGAWLAEYCPR
ncbi:hypothetical protein F0U44_12515 [Nocardioides humilatus]|uniref:Uncharacterized protein n=1 Tax=Nocardioides humilatus TaxID=2607660 RepID=A0A5B1LF45_9ACTN|nr:hypothetical protein [Nocardioides humilatus]KAA1419262.1 hypothetical protein F0U44_12515 [Nocardioides humilatus]